MNTKQDIRSNRRLLIVLYWVTFFGSEQVDDDEVDAHPSLPPRQRLVRSLHFLFNVDRAGARKTSRTERAVEFSLSASLTSSNSPSSDEVLLSSMGTETWLPWLDDVVVELLFAIIKVHVTSRVTLSGCRQGLLFLEKFLLCWHKAYAANYMYLYSSSEQLMAPCLV